MKIKLILISLLGIFTITACGQKKAPQRTFMQESREETVMVEEVHLRNLNEYIRLSGVLEGNIDISFNSEVSGKIVQIYKNLGDSVKKGEAIAKIDNKDYEIQVLQAEAAVLAAEASKVSAETLFNTNERLFENKKISEVEYHNSLSAYKNALSQLQGVKANYESRKRAFENTQFFAPVTGQIVDLPVKIGQTVTVGQKIAGIVDMEYLILRTGVGENSIRSVFKGQTATLSYRNSDKKYFAEVSGVGYKPLANIATYPVEIKIKNQNFELLPGMVVNSELLSYIHRNVVYTSQNHILKEYDQHFVFVIDSDSIARRRNIALGKKISENVIITDGLKSGDRLVVEGYDNIDDGSKVIVKMIETNVIEAVQEVPASQNRKTDKDSVAVLTMETDSEND